MNCRPNAGAQLDSDQYRCEIALSADAAAESGRSAMTSVQSNASESELHHREVEDQPVQAAIALLQGKWKIAILTRLKHGPLRLSQLRRMLPGASKKMLTQRLREMEEDGLVVRSDRSTKVRHVEYSLSESHGFPVLYLIDMLTQWGRQHKPASSAKKCSTGLPKNNERGEVRAENG